MEMENGWNQEWNIQWTWNQGINKQWIHEE